MNINTVKQLRKYLDDFESTWSEEDRHFLGEFKDIEIRVPYFSLDGKSTFQGYGLADIQYDGGLGFILQQRAEE